MAPSLFKLETPERKPADPPEFSTVVYTWKPGRRETR
jgi:hypothetical protein